MGQVTACVVEPPESSADTCEVVKRGGVNHRGEVAGQPNAVALKDPPMTAPRRPG
jgi:hypothetical protein